MPKRTQEELLSEILDIVDNEISGDAQIQIHKRIKKMEEGTKKIECLVKSYKCLTTLQQELLNEFKLNGEERMELVKREAIKVQSTLDDVSGAITDQQYNYACMAMKSIYDIATESDCELD